MNKFKIIEDCYYTSNGCSCCDPDKWMIYRVEINGEDQEESFQSVEEAKEFILQNLEIEFW